MKKARSYASKHRPVVPLDGLQSAIATAKSEAGRKRAASFLVRAAEHIDERRNNMSCCALDEAHREAFGFYCDGNITLALPEGRLFAALYEGSRNRDEDGVAHVGWFDNGPVGNSDCGAGMRARTHRVYALLFAAAVMLDPS